MDNDVEPTTYETPDSPKTDYAAHPPPPEYQSEYISDEPVNSEAARNKFDKSQADGTTADFRSPKTRGWQISTRPESSIEKIARLRREIELLSTETEVCEQESLLNNLEATCVNQPLTRVAEMSGKVTAKINLETIEKLSLLESRISSIEERIGSNTEVNLSAQIELLRLKVCTISEEEATADIIRRLKHLNDESAMMAKSPVISRVEDLYKTAGSLRSLAKSTPMILARLRSLQGVHEHAAESKMKLEAIKSALSSQRTEVESWSQALQSMEKQMAEGKVTLHQNIEVLGSVVEPLLRRLNN